MPSGSHRRRCRVRSSRLGQRVGDRYGAPGTFATGIDARPAGQGRDPGGVRRRGAGCRHPRRRGILRLPRRRSAVVRGGVGPVRDHAGRVWRSSSCEPSTPWPQPCCSPRARTSEPSPGLARWTRPPVGLQQVDHPVPPIGGLDHHLGIRARLCPRRRDGQRIIGDPSGRELLARRAHARSPTGGDESRYRPTVDP